MFHQHKNTGVLMGGSIVLLSLFLMAVIAVVIMTAIKNRPEDTFQDLEVEEWDCPECGFHVQAGDRCIYCDTPKPAQE